MFSSYLKIYRTFNNLRIIPNSQSQIWKILFFSLSLQFVVVVVVVVVVVISIKKLTDFFLATHNSLAKNVLYKAHSPIDFYTSILISLLLEKFLDLGQARPIYWAYSVCSHALRSTALCNWGAYCMTQLILKSGVNMDIQRNLLRTGINPVKPNANTLYW